MIGARAFVYCARRWFEGGSVRRCQKKIVFIMVQDIDFLEVRRRSYACAASTASIGTRSVGGGSRKGSGKLFLANNWRRVDAVGGRHGSICRRIG